MSCLHSAVWMAWKIMMWVATRWSRHRKHKSTLTYYVRLSSLVFLMRIISVNRMVRNRTAGLDKNHQTTVFVRNNFSKNCKPFWREFPACCWERKVVTPVEFLNGITLLRQPLPRRLVKLLFLSFAVKKPSSQGSGGRVGNRFRFGTLYPYVRGVSPTSLLLQ